MLSVLTRQLRVRIPILKQVMQRESQENELLSLISDNFAFLNQLTLANLKAVLLLTMTAFYCVKEEIQASKTNLGTAKLEMLLLLLLNLVARLILSQESNIDLELFLTLSFISNNLGAIKELWNSSSLLRLQKHQVHCCNLASFHRR